MKVRACVVAAAIAAALCWSPSARAQEPAPAASSPPAVDVPTVNIVDVARFFTAPRALGDAWERAVQAVLDGMRVVVEAERAAAQRTLAAVPPKQRASSWGTALPAQETRKAPRPVAFHPVAVEPVTQTVSDVRGQRAILLGASVELPWTVP